MRLAAILAVLAIASLACGGKPDAEDSSEDPPTGTTPTDDTGTATTAGDDTGPTDLPESTLPFTLRIGGDATGEATFDTVVCANPPNDQLQLTWTDSSNTYTWNMRAFVRETFTGAAVYATSVEVQLYENFSGGRYFAGSDAAVTIDGAGSNGAYGSFTTGALDGDAGSITLSPQPIPIWCDAIEE